MYKVYQLQRVNEVITHNEEHGDSSTYDVKMNVIAEYAERNAEMSGEQIAEDVWDACNVDCWNSEWKEGDVVTKENTTTYPTEHFQGYCNSDIVVETKDGMYLADSFGWTKVATLEEATYRIIYCYTFINWRDIRNKADFDENKLDQIIKQVREEWDAKYKE